MVLGRGANAPLRLTAAKSRLGHSEPVSGTLGITQSVAMLAAGCANAIVHLRHVNPMVAGLLQQHAAAPGHAAPYLPRQDGPGVLASSGGGDSGAPSLLAATGVSAFAFQGTNAHAVLGRVASAHPAAVQPSQHAWQLRRCWFAPAPHALLARLAAGGGGGSKGVVHLQAALTASSSLAYLWDHQVAGRALFPAAAMFEAAYAASAMLLDPGSATASGTVASLPALTSVSIPAPLVLGLGTLIVLHTSVDDGSGGVWVRTGGGRQPAVHLAGRPARIHMAPGGMATAAEGVPELEGSLLARQLTGTLGAAGAAPAPAAIASLVHSQRQQGEQYKMHPAVIDNATQVSAALNSNSGSSTGGGSNPQPVTRVPVGVQSLALPGGMHAGPACATWWAGGSLAAMHPDGSIACSYSLAPAVMDAATAAGNSSLAIRGFLVKAISAVPGGASSATSSLDRAAAEEEEEPTEHHTYVVCWQVSSAIPAQGHARRPPLRSGIEWRVGGSSCLVLRPQDSGADFYSVQASLRLLQGVTSTGRRAPVSLHTPLVMPGLPADTAASYAAAAGLLKVAAQVRLADKWAGFLARLHRYTPTNQSVLLVYNPAVRLLGPAAVQFAALDRGVATAVPLVLLSSTPQEHKAQQFVHVIHDGYTHGSCALPEAEPGDIFGAVLSEGAVATPLLARIPAALMAAAGAAEAAGGAVHCGGPLCGSVVMTGGLGDIGQLAGRWAAEAGAPRVWLLGRSGRTSNGDAQLAPSSAGRCVTALSCDITQAADVANLAAVLQAASSAVSCTMHAGAVLRDALLARQTVRTLRQVYAPKVGA